jgi:hypothetical protein
MKNHKTSQLRPRTYNVLQLAIEDGVKCGWHRAHKHTENPNEEDIYQAIESAVMDSICEWFIFDDEE